MGGAGDRVRRVVRCGLWIGGMVDELGEAAGVRAVCGVPHRRGNGGCVLGVEDGGLSNQDSRVGLFALIPNTHFEIICSRGTSISYHRSVREFLQADCDSASTRRDTQPSPKAEERFVRLLTPTENKRLNELVGFLCIIVAVLLAAALISYSPQDAAFNVSRQSSDGGAVRNWVGPVGAYSADLLFQVFGFGAFLLPMAMLVVGWRWFRSHAIDSQVVTLG